MIEGSLIEQVEKTMDLLTTKYMKANIAYEGITRTETYDYPESALREAVLNAIIHKDYSSNVPVQISVYSRWLMIYNSGRLPEGWTLETLKKKHSSIPANPDIARVFFRAGYIENWGRGISDIVKYCKNAGLPEPFYRQMGAGFALVFEQEQGAANFSYEQDDKEDVGENIKTSGKSSQKSSRKSSQKSSQKIVEYMKNNPDITTQEIADLMNMSRRNIAKHIATLKKKGLVERIGSDKSGQWKVKTVE